MRAFLVVCAVAGCYRASPRPPPLTPSPQASPALVAEPRRDSELYALDEALADALSGPLEFIGTGPWWGMFRVNACAYRNARVIVVNIYCTAREKRAFRIDVLSPTRGRASIYAEADHPISKLTRADYFTFKAETHPVPRPSLRPLSLGWSYSELAAWDKERYHTYTPGCFGGVEIRRPLAGCMQALESHAAAWQERNRAFLAEPPADWYRIVNELRALARRDARPFVPSAGP